MDAKGNPMDPDGYGPAKGLLPVHLDYYRKEFVPQWSEEKSPTAGDVEKALRRKFGGGGWRLIARDLHGLKTINPSKWLQVGRPTTNKL